MSRHSRSAPVSGLFPAIDPKIAAQLQAQAQAEAEAQARAAGPVLQFNDKQLMAMMAAHLLPHLSDDIPPELKPTHAVNCAIELYSQAVVRHPLLVARVAQLAEAMKKDAEAEKSRLVT